MRKFTYDALAIRDVAKVGIIGSDKVLYKTVLGRSGYLLSVGNYLTIDSGPRTTKLA
jgi:hypothetical protein